MIQGPLIAESLRPGARLEGLGATLVSIERWAQKHAPGHPPETSTLIRFESSEPPERLAAALAEVLDDAPAQGDPDLRAGEERFVVFPKRVFRCRLDGLAGRAVAQEYARSLGVLPQQVAWGE